MITHIWRAEQSIKTARCNESPAVCSGPVRDCLTRKGFRCEAATISTTSELESSTDLLDETVKLERTSAFRIALPPSTEALRPLYREMAQFKNFGGADSPAKQQVPIDRLSVVRDVGTGKRNAYP